MAQKSVLFLCIGNGDRSPVMAAVFGMFARKAGLDVNCESAGIEASATKGTAAKFGIVAAKRIGLDISDHMRRHISAVNLKNYDLIVCASDEIAGTAIAAGADMKKVYNVQITNPWPVQFQEDFDNCCMPAILVAMYKVVRLYAEHLS